MSQNIIEYDREQELLLYAYAVGERSSRQIERRCREDVAFRVLAGNQIPDHATIARFRTPHEEGHRAACRPPLSGQATEPIPP